MKIFVGILVTMIVGYMWTWLVDRAFSSRKIRRRLTLRMGLYGLLLVALLFLYKSGLARLGWESQYFLTNWGPQSLLLFVLYCTLLILILIVFHHNLKQRKILHLVVVGSLLFAGVSLGGYFLGINIFIMYYILSAYAEEYLKFGTGNNIFLGETKKNKSDLVLFCVLMGLGFSGIENLFFVAQNVWAAMQAGTEISTGVLSTGRGLVATLLHVVSTGVIAYVTLYFEKTEREIQKRLPTFVPIVLALLVGVGIHAVYNLSLYYGLKILLIPLVIVCYFVLSFLLFRSDSLYGGKIEDISEHT